MKNGKLQIAQCGTKRWYLNNKLHRIDGPAIIWPAGSKEWYINGLRHRLDGPAIIYCGGHEEWYINKVYYTEDQFNNIILTKWIRLFK